MIKTKANLIIAVISLVICLNADDSVLSNEFYTNHFTDTDVSNWTIGGNNPPSDHFFTECASERIFGGKIIFIKDTRNSEEIQFILLKFRQTTQV